MKGPHMEPLETAIRSISRQSGLRQKLVPVCVVWCRWSRNVFVPFEAGSSVDRPRVLLAIGFTTVLLQQNFVIQYTPYD